MNVLLCVAVGLDRVEDWKGMRQEMNVCLFHTGNFGLFAFSLVHLRDSDARNDPLLLLLLLRSSLDLSLARLGECCGRRLFVSVQRELEGPVEGLSLNVIMRAVVTHVHVYLLVKSLTHTQTHTHNIPFAQFNAWHVFSFSLFYCLAACFCCT